MPSTEISNCVKECKQLLIKEIGRFGSDKISYSYHYNGF